MMSPGEIGLSRLGPAPAQDNSGSVVRTMMFFSTAMLTVPIFLYFFSKSLLFEGWFGMTNSNSYFYAAIVAIVAVHVILGFFVYAAWKEGVKAVSTIKRD